MKPIVMVLLSAYNGSKYISEQIESILSQKYVEVKLFIRDDGSTDNTLELVNRFEYNTDSKVFIIRGKNVGFAKSFYELVHLAPTADFYAFADQDDVWLPEKLFKCLKFLTDNDKPQLCFSECIVTDANLESIKYGHHNGVHIADKYYNFFINPAQGCSMVFNKKAKDLFVLANEDMIEYHDHWLFSLCSFFGDVFYESEPLFYYRQHGDNQVGHITSFKESVRHRIKMLKKDTHHIERNAKEMLRLFNNDLNDEEKEFFKLIASYRNGIRAKYKLLTNKSIKKILMDKRQWMVKTVLFNKL